MLIVGFACLQHTCSSTIHRFWCEGEFVRSVRVCSVVCEIKRVHTGVFFLYFFSSLFGRLLALSWLHIHTVIYTHRHRFASSIRSHWHFITFLMYTFIRVRNSLRVCVCVVWLLFRWSCMSVYNIYIMILKIVYIGLWIVRPFLIRLFPTFERKRTFQFIYYYYHWQNSLALI